MDGTGYITQVRQTALCVSRAGLWVVGLWLAWLAGFVGWRHRGTHGAEQLCGPAVEAARLRLMV